MSEPDCTDVCEVVIAKLQSLGFKISDESDHSDILEALDKVKFAKNGGRNWECYLLSEDDIKEVAERKGISLEGIDFEDVIHYIKKGIEWALDNRDEIIADAIRQAGR